MRGPWLGVTLSVCLLAATGARAEEKPARDGSCSQPPDFYHGKFKIHSVQIRHPFSFLRFIGQETAAMLGGDQLPKRDSVVDLNEVIAGKNSIAERRFLPSPASPRVRVDAVVAALANCRAEALDVIYYVFSSQIFSVGSRSFESRPVERSDPQSIAGVNSASPFRLVPQFGYDASNKLQGGGRFDWRVRRSGVSAISAEGSGSARAHRFAATVSGARTPNEGGLALIEWELDYLRSLAPTQAASLREGRLSARFAAATRSLGESSFLLRFGGSLEGGHQQSGFTGADVAANTIANSGYGSLKLYAGLTGRPKRQAVQFSYGIDLGVLGASTQIAYRRHIGDAGYSFTVPLGDHRELEVESRFTAGAIQTPGRIPLPQRFFGGNVERPFIAGDSWRIRANPVLRSFPANRLNLAGNGAGAEEFFSHNLTVAATGWRRALVPKEVTGLQDFKDAIDEQFSIVPGLLAADRMSKDSHFKEAAKGLAELLSRLLALEATVSAATVPPPLETARKLCRGRIAAVKSTLNEHEKKKSAELFALVNSMVDSDSLMAKANRACLIDLNEKLADASIAAKGKDLEEQIGAIKRPFDSIDNAAYEAKAEKETAPIRRTIDRILYDTNLYSISPVFAFDTARIGDLRAGTSGGLRHGAGGGVRVTLVNSVSFTVGYMVNINRRPFEGRGALFFALAFRDLIE